MGPWTSLANLVLGMVTRNKPELLSQSVVADITWSALINNCVPLSASSIDSIVAIEPLLFLVGGKLSVSGAFALIIPLVGRMIKPLLLEVIRQSGLFTSTFNVMRTDVGVVCDWVNPILSTPCLLTAKFPCVKLGDKVALRMSINTVSLSRLLMILV